MTTEGPRILVIDDEAQIRRFLTSSLTAHGYRVQAEETGQAGLRETPVFHPDLILLDLSLPDRDGVEVLRELREWSSTPVIVLSVREREEDKIAALDAGADDYLTKPFSMGELLARLRVALRHSARTESEPVITSGALVIDLSRRQVTRAGREVSLTPTEWQIVRILASHAGRVVTHRQLLREVWGPQFEAETHYLRVFLSGLRRKLEDDPTRPRYFLTEPGVGYRFAEDA
ncbi:MAG TPA: response regulator [Armatimonadota bacterium]|jgi:two-component system KDP operon response regulator KdpE